jgi:hypothetical protein
LKQQASERKVEHQPAEAVNAAKEEAASRKRSGKLEIPTILPAEFLTDSESEEDEESLESVGGARPRKKRTVSAVEKRMSRDGRGPRDEVIGSTVYKVSKEADERLAPKVQKFSKNTKDLLLKRGRAPVQARSGFFKN